MIDEWWRVTKEFFKVMPYGTELLITLGVVVALLIIFALSDRNRS